jgi:hypothetical protein
MRTVDLQDDPINVPDSAILYRRVDWDRIGGRDRAIIGTPPKLSANCFTDYPETKAREYGFDGPCMSVAISTVLIKLGYTPEKLLEKHPEYGLAKILARDLRTLKKADGSDCPQGIMLAAIDDEPWHGVVFDLNERPRKSAVSKAIFRVADWEIPLIRDS